MKLTPAEKTALDAHGIEKALEAFRLNETDGEGPSTIAVYLDVPFRVADALINAGRKKATELFGVAEIVNRARFANFRDPARYFAFTEKGQLHATLINWEDRHNILPSFERAEFGMPIYVNLDKRIATML